MAMKRQERDAEYLTRGGGDRASPPEAVRRSRRSACPGRSRRAPRRTSCWSTCPDRTASRCTIRSPRCCTRCAATTCAPSWSNGQRGGARAHAGHRRPRRDPAGSTKCRPGVADTVGPVRPSRTTRPEAGAPRWGVRRCDLIQAAAAENGRMAGIEGYGRGLRGEGYGVRATGGSATPATRPASRCAPRRCTHRPARQPVAGAARLRGRAGPADVVLQGLARLDEPHVGAGAWAAVVGGPDPVAGSRRRRGTPAARRRGP